MNTCKYCNVQYDPDQDVEDFNIDDFCSEECEDAYLDESEENDEFEESNAD